MKLHHAQRENSGTEYKITPNTTLKGIRRNIGASSRERKRTSERRRNRLERLARWVSGEDVVVKFVDKQARCEDRNGVMVISVPSDEHEQVETDLDPAVWDFVFQKAELVHELLHVLYTDFEVFEEYIDEADDMYRKQVFKSIFNIAEDGAIERQGAAKMNIENDLKIKNENLLRATEPGMETVNGNRSFGLWGGLQVVLMDKVKYDVGRARKLLNPKNDDYYLMADEEREALVELLPRIFEFREEVLSEPNGGERIRIAWDFYEDIIEVLEEEGDIEEPPETEELMQQFANDGEVYVVRPGDEEPEDAEELELGPDDTVIVLGEPEGEGGEGDDEEGPEVRYGEEVEADAPEEDEEVKNVEQWAKSVEKTGSHLAYVDGSEVEKDNWRAAEKYASRFEKELRRTLQHERESESIPGQRAGRPDMQSLWKLGYGESRVFTNERDPEEKDYNVVLLLDRSGSMGGDHGQEWIVDEVESVAAGLSIALENLGVKTAILGVGRDVYLEKAFGETTENAKGRVCRDHSDGSTPLATALELAEDQLERRQGTPLVFSLTDGMPDREGEYLNTLERVTFPVVGAYIGGHSPSKKEAEGLYHRLVREENSDHFSGSVLNLIERMVV